MSERVIDTGSTQGKVLSIRLPIRDKTLLFPYSMVAEVSNLSLRPADGAFLGRVEWRGVRVPVFSLERGCGQTADVLAGRVRLAVLYGTKDPASRPYFALVLSGMPRTGSVSAAQLLAAEVGQDSCELIGIPATLEGETVYLPDVQVMETWMDSVEQR